MQTLWTAMDLVEVRHSTRSVHHIAKQSTPQEWATMASSFFEKGKYELAMHAYERASLRREHAVTRAYHLKEQAMICPLTIDRHGITRTEAFTAAAEAFMEIAHAAAAFKERVTYFTNAAHCFASTGDDTNTARAYYGAAQYTYAAQHYCKLRVSRMCVGSSTSGSINGTLRETSSAATTK